MKEKIVIFIIGLAILINVILLVKSISRPVSENDEGVYATTFLLVDKEYKLYKEVFFSQPPGFFLTVYPAFLLFGKTVQAARLTILLWAGMGLISLICLMGLRKKIMIGLLAILILLSIPSFYKQIITFQSDALAVVFSIFAFISINRYIQLRNSSAGQVDRSSLKWLFFSAVFFSLAFWTKFDVSILIPVMAILFINKKTLTNYLLLVSVFILLSMIFVVPFGFKEVFDSVINLRRQAVAVYSWQPIELWKFLSNDKLLLAIVISTPLLYFLKRKKNKSIETILIVWSLSSLIQVLLYRPIFPHHLIFLAVPFTLSFSWLLNSYKRLSRIILVFFAGIAILNGTMGLMRNNKSDLIHEQKIGLQIIKRYSRPDDFVVSDEAILNVMSGRLPPPELVDLSYVRIKSGNLTVEKFRQLIKKYQPKLILAWNGRLSSMQGLERILNDYKLIETVDGWRNVYYLK